MKSWKTISEHQAAAQAKEIPVQVDGTSRRDRKKSVKVHPAVKDVSTASARVAGSTARKPQSKAVSIGIATVGFALIGFGIAPLVLEDFDASSLLKASVNTEGFSFSGDMQNLDQFAQSGGGMKIAVPKTASTNLQKVAVPTSATNLVKSTATTSAATVPKTNFSAQAKSVKIPTTNTTTSSSVRAATVPRPVATTNLQNSPLHAAGQVSVLDGAQDAGSGIRVNPHAGGNSNQAQVQNAQNENFTNLSRTVNTGPEAWVTAAFAFLAALILRKSRKGEV